MAKKKNKKRNLREAQPEVRLSQCMIVKNEEKNIERALSWAKGIAFEQIVVDTGSVDRTVEIAQKLGAKVYHFSWISDFSAAKNYAIEKATGNWIAFLDADEYFTPADAEKMMYHIKQIQSTPALRTKWFAVNCPWAQLNDSGNPFAIFAQERVFRSFIRYVGRIHEHIDMDVSHLYRVDDITIMHTGYTQAAYGETQKADRNIEMLRAELIAKNDDLNIKSYLADSLIVKGGLENHSEAVTLYKQVIEGGPEVHPVLKKKAYTTLMDMYKESADRLSECEEICRKGIREFQNDIDLDYYLGYILNQKKEFKEAWEVFQRCEKNLLKSSALDDSVIVSIRPQVLFIQMALAAQGLENVEGVVRYSTMVLREDKNYEGVLKPYIWILLKHGATEDEVLGLLAKMYDMDNPGDLVFIGRAAKDCGAISLARRVLGLAQERINRHSQ
ncbi:MAG: glycosyltransferase family 2 protein [Oscillospiraceae bacterium]|nr:glycosyltransferase family 2 protein [Oscillospiraceae bacterium]